MFCLSKGLGAPIGSILAGDREFIREARRLKILFGGAWRQAGIMAAAGLIALEEGPKRLHEDHDNARTLAEGIAELLPGSVDPDLIETNIVFVDVSGTGRDATQWRERLAAEGVLVTMIGGPDPDADARRHRRGRHPGRAGCLAQRRQGWLALTVSACRRARRMRASNATDGACGIRGGGYFARFAPLDITLSSDLNASGPQTSVA